MDRNIVAKELVAVAGMLVADRTTDLFKLRDEVVKREAEVADSLKRTVRLFETMFHPSEDALYERPDAARRKMEKRMKGLDEAEQVARELQELAFSIS